MVAGAAGTFSIRMGGFLAFSLPAGIPIITRFFLFGDEIHIFMGVMLLLFTMLMFFNAKRINVIITSSLKLQFENKDLIAFLTSEKERADDGILIIQDTLIKLANPSFARMSGYTHEEIADRPFMKYCHPDEVERLTRMYQRRMTGDALPRVYESAFVHKDGYRIDIEISGGLINYNGKPADLVFIRDIRERKKAKEEKRELETSHQRAEKMEAIGQLAGGVAYDLNNVLTGLVGYPELMLMDIEENNPLRESILIMKSSAQKASAIVQDLLTLARRGVAVTEVVNLNDIVNDYLGGVEHEKLKSYYPNVQFEIDLQGKLLNILGSPIHLSKALMNLVSNAAEAVTGVGKVIISTRNRYVDKTIEGYDRVELETIGMAVRRELDK